MLGARWEVWKGHWSRAFGWKEWGRTRDLWQLWPCSDRVGADITVLREREVDYDSDTPRKITEVLVRKVPDNQQVRLQPSLPFMPVLPGGPCGSRLSPGPGSWGCPGH